MDKLLRISQDHPQLVTYTLYLMCQGICTGTSYFLSVYLWMPIYYRQPRMATYTTVNSQCLAPTCKKTAINYDQALAKHLLTNAHHTLILQQEMNTLQYFLRLPTENKWPCHPVEEGTNLASQTNEPTLATCMLLASITSQMLYHQKNWKVIGMPQAMQEELPVK